MALNGYRKWEEFVTSSPRLLTVVFLILTVSIVATVPMMYVGTIDTTKAKKKNREGLNLEISPTTFAVEKRSSFFIKASRDFDSACYRLSGRIEELGYRQEFTRGELLHGVRSEINPRETGPFQFHFVCDDEKEIGSVAIAVIPPGATAEAAKLNWVLDAGKPIHKTASFEIPIFVRAVVVKGNQQIPRAVPNDTTFTVVDSHGNLQSPVNITLQRNNAISGPVYIPFPIHRDYALIASNLNTGKQSNVLDLKWDDRGPKLRLAVWPEELEIYAAPASIRSAQVYLEGDGQQLKPAGPMDIYLKAPLKVISNPSDKVAITPQAPSGKYEVRGGSQAGSVSTGFKEPSLDLSSILTIQIRPIKWLLLAAALAGFIGVACGRGMSLFSERGLALIIGLATAAVAGWLLYWALLMQWIPPVLSESAVGVGPAIFFGILGGYLGLSVFKILAAVISGGKLLPK